MVEYIYFEDFGSTKLKTKQVRVMTKSKDERLGVIMWFSSWRRYVFWPEIGTFFSASCLEHINRKIKQLVAQRKREQNKHRGGRGK